MPGHLVPLLLVHLLALQGLHRAPLDVGGGGAFGFLQRVAVLDQLLVQPLDLYRRRGFYEAVVRAGSELFILIKNELNPPPKK